MLQVDLSKAVSFVDTAAFEEAKKKSAENLKAVQNKTGKGSEWLGWRQLVAQPNDALLEEIDSLATEIRENADVLIVAGIGGSYLGAKAVIDSLTPFFGSKKPEIIYAGHQISGKYLQQLIAYLSETKADGTTKSVYLNVISKSGTTLETALAFRVIRNWMLEAYGEEANSRITATTSAEGGALNKSIDAFGYKKFILPDDVGGRFSVLSPVGLLPIAVAGIDIRALLYGAVDMFNATEKDPTNLLDYAALRYALHQNGVATDVIASFHPELSGMGAWMQQLLGESEGKGHKGLFPAVVGYSTDLHSLGQMVQDGQRNLLETFIRIANEKDSLIIPEDEANTDGLNYLAGKSYEFVNDKAFEGTRGAHSDGGIPVLTVNLDRLDAAHIGAFIYFYEIFTAVYCYNLDVNPFDQPGVEDYKKAMYALLGK